jgi:hypothetical protein
LEERVFQQKQLFSCHKCFVAIADGHTHQNLDLLSAFKVPRWPFSKHQLESLDQKLVNESFWGGGLWMRMLETTHV